MLTLKAGPGRVLLERSKVKEVKSGGGIIIPGQTITDQTDRMAKVIASGPAKQLEGGQTEEIHVSDGDMIFFSFLVTTKFFWFQKEYWSVMREDIIAYIAAKDLPETEEIIEEEEVETGQESFEEEPHEVDDKKVVEVS